MLGRVFEETSRLGIFMNAVLGMVTVTALGW